MNEGYLQILLKIFLTRVSLFITDIVLTVTYWCLDWIWQDTTWWWWWGDIRDISEIEWPWLDPLQVLSGVLSHIKTGTSLPTGNHIPSDINLEIFHQLIMFKIFHGIIQWKYFSLLDHLPWKLGKSLHWLNWKEVADYSARPPRVEFPSNKNIWAALKWNIFIVCDKVDNCWLMDIIKEGWAEIRLMLSRLFKYPNIYLQNWGRTEEHGAGCVGAQERLARCLRVEQGVVSNIASSEHHVGQGGGRGIFGCQGSASSRGGNLSRIQFVRGVQNNTEQAQARQTKAIYIIVFLLSTIIRVERYHTFLLGLEFSLSTIS